MPLRFLVLLFLPVEPRIEPTGLFLLDGRLCGRAGVCHAGVSGPGIGRGARVSCRPGIDGRCRVRRRGRTGIDRCGRPWIHRRGRRGLADEHDAVARLIVAARLERGRNELAVTGVDVAVGLDLVAGVGGLLDLALAGGELVVSTISSVNGMVSSTSVLIFT